MRRPARFAVAATTLAVSLAAALFLLTRPSLRPVATWEQPDSVSYGQWGPYYLSAVQMEPDWRGFPLSFRRHYIIYVGLEPGKPTYGHEVGYSFNNGLEDLEEYIRSCSVSWSSGGVALSEPDGHVLFIPATAFVGGR
jgi:hypothetical protein